MNNLKVLYEDNHLIAVYKPAGVLVQGDISGDTSLMDIVKEYLKEKYQKPGNVFLGLVHRLDRRVQGIVVFAKTSKGASRLSEQFRDNQITKIYHAVVQGEMKSKSGELKNYLLKDEVNKKAIVFDSPKVGASEAILTYEVIRSNSKYSLLKINLQTGRFHQIRAQLSHIGHPIVGDSKYGSKEKVGGEGIALAATEIIFKTATSEEVIDLKIDIPKEWSKII